MLDNPYNGRAGGVYGPFKPFTRWARLGRWLTWTSRRLLDWTVFGARRRLNHQQRYVLAILLHNTSVDGQLALYGGDVVRRAAGIVGRLAVYRVLDELLQLGYLAEGPDVDISLDGRIPRVRHWITSAGVDAFTSDFFTLPASLR